MSKSSDQKDTGVSNGDVDWLFRGKIKKHGKGNSAEPDVKLKTPKAPVILSPNDGQLANSESVTDPIATKSKIVDVADKGTPNAPGSAAGTGIATGNVGVDTIKATGNEPAKFPDFVPNADESLEHIKSVKSRSRSSSISSTLTRKSIDSVDSSKRRPSVSGSESVESGKSKKSLFSSLSSKFSKKKVVNTQIESESKLPKLQTSANVASSLPVSAPVADVNTSSEKSVGSLEETLGLVSPGCLPTTSMYDAHMASPPKSGISTEFSPTDGTRKRFGSLRGKMSAKINNGGVNGQKAFQPPAPTERIILNRNPNKAKVPIDELNNLKMKRVIFDCNVLNHDPPQQIPSRKPKKGNVLIPEDMSADTPRVSVGIANSEKKLSELELKDVNQKQYLLAVESQKKALEESRKHAHDAHLSALRIANEVANYKLSKNGHLLPTAVDVEYGTQTSTNETFHSNGIDIDKPMHVHEHHFDDDGLSDEDDANSDKEVSLETLYTRCCHLREILPIPATLKQLKGKSRPLPVLKFLNPKPTLIDILSFSDFIAISPISTIIFDNVILTNEMFKIVLTSLASNQSLEKLSLKNLMIDAEAWRYLCKFLLKNTNLVKLDLSQTKYRSDLSPEYYRFNMNWNLFIDVLKKRGGIFELVLTGIDFRFEDFKALVENGISVSTKRLGLASSNLSSAKCQVISNWINMENSTCEGLDLGFNDLDSDNQLSKFDIKNSGNSKLVFFSLNATNLSNFKEFSVFLQKLSTFPNLSFLDLSSLPNLFPKVIPHLKKNLPKFPNLKRIHFDYNHLPAKHLALILDILQMCPKLIHVSLIGNDVGTIGASLYSCVKTSRSIFNLDIDYDSIPELISSKIAIVLMRNMELNLHGEEAIQKSNNDSAEDDLIFDGSLLAESAEAFLSNKGGENEDISNKLLKKSLMKKTKIIRSEIHTTIDALFEKRNKGELTIEGKERLLRFCILDSALEKIVHLFESTDDNNNNSNNNNFNGQATDHDSLFTNEDRNDETADESTPKSEDINKFDSIGDGNFSGGVLQSADDEEYMHNLSKDLINTNSSSINRMPSSEIQYLNPLQAQFPAVSQSELPHQLAIEKSTDGKEISVDTATGRPVLFRNISQTSVNAKKQEQEEGEFHKWGFFVQQHEEPSVMSNLGSNMANATSAAASAIVSSFSSAGSSTAASTEVKPAKPTNSTGSGVTSSATPGSSGSNGDKLAVTPKLLNLITGEELRKAVMKAKGINSIDDLIDKVEHKSMKLDNIYRVPEAEEEHEEENVSALPGSESGAKEAVSKAGYDDNNDNESFKSIDSMSNQVNDLTLEDDETKAVDETYDKLLNEVVRVRSNK